MGGRYREPESERERCLTLRGSQATSCLSSSATMPSLHHLTLLCSLSFLSAVLSIQCPQSQYARPKQAPTFCCDSCPPGKHMVWRSESTCEIRCKSCLSDQYSNNSNTELSCNFCQICDKLTMEYKSRCNSTHNAVCRCKAGYRCNKPNCEECVWIPTTTMASILPPTTTTASILPPTTTTASTLSPTTTTKVQPPSSGDTMWFLAIVVLLCAIVAIFVIAKVHSLQNWIRYKLGLFLAKKSAPVQTCSEADEVSKPIQEVCGKCDHVLDV
ncbi:tumor necrosis factor receptor superfamily member 6 [Cheilinus undulatus]|uniref:tumor necrosis factor receptor superfamily member 6 n=1 Tax=Cheilinus undulatus TaxID=241271 RepID=UPI001BD36F51|nr:tumor necrosis factor receptor superfamily member 6 [Cheilinus undulatus]